MSGCWCCLLNRQNPGRTSTRSVSLFSFYQGVTFLATALGPIFGTLLISLSGNNLVVYYLTITCRVCWLLCLLVVVPESLSPSKRRHAQLAYSRATREALPPLLSIPAWRRPLVLLNHFTLQPLIDALRPLLVLLPRRVFAKDDTAEPGSRPVLCPRRKPGALDRNLFYVALCYGLQMMVAGLMLTNMQYSKLVFGWGAEELGAYISLMSASRLLVLVLVLPLVIRLLKRTPAPPTARPVTEGAEQDTWDKETARVKLTSDSVFDLKLPRWSTLLAMVAYLVTGVPSDTPAWFIAGTLVLSLAVGTMVSCFTRVIRPSLIAEGTKLCRSPHSSH